MINLKQSPHHTLTQGRISVVHRTCYDVISTNGLFQCELTGSILYGKSASEHEKRKKEKSFTKLVEEVKKHKGNC